MNKFPSNVYEKQKLYNDILLNNKNSKNPAINNKNLNIKPGDNKQNEIKNISVSESNPGKTLSNNLNSKANQTEIKPSEKAKFKSEEIKNDTTEQKGKNDTKTQKPKVERIKLDEKTLFYSENGLKKFYEIITQNSFKENRSELHNLNKLIQLHKNWHFMLFPKYNIDFFNSKILDLGKKPAGRAYMSRLRKIYKGEENWDSIYNQQDEILNINAKSKINQTETNPTSPTTNKVFKEDTNLQPKTISLDKIAFNNADKSKPPFNKITNKLNNVSISNNANRKNSDDYNIEEIQDLVFQNVEVNRKENNDLMFDVNEEDYMNFEDIHNDNDDNSTSKPDSFVYKNEKRNYLQAFGENSVDNIQDLDNKSSRKMKLK